ncbi:MAG: hypothetical protein AAF610_06215 [Pseudomonadota bacterium]
MTKQELLQRARALWPETIPLSSALVADGVIHAIPILNSIYQPIEASIDRSDNWLVVSTWSFQQALYQAACDAVLSGQTELATSDVALTAFDQKMHDNLCDQTYADEQAAYQTLV